MKSIFIVKGVDELDTCILGVFSTREKAENFKDSYTGGDGFFFISCSQYNVDEEENETHN